MGIELYSNEGKKMWSFSLIFILGVYKTNGDKIYKS